jgi:hypothetical protein
VTEPIPQAESAFQATIGRLARCVFGKTRTIEEPIQPWEVRRKRELSVERTNLDLAMASLLDDLRSTRMEAGLVSYESPVRSPRMDVLELGRSELISQRNSVLRELANL